MLSKPSFVAMLLMNNVCPFCTLHTKKDILHKVLQNNSHMNNNNVIGIVCLVCLVVKSYYLLIECCRY